MRTTVILILAALFFVSCSNHPKQISSNEWDIKLDPMDPVILKRDSLRQLIDFNTSWISKQSAFLDSLVDSGSKDYETMKIAAKSITNAQEDVKEWKKQIGE